MAAAIAGIAGVKIANHNAPKQTILSGTRAAIVQARSKLDAAGIARACREGVRSKELAK